MSSAHRRPLWAGESNPTTSSHQPGTDAASSVKTRIQLAPAEYKAGGLFGGLRRVVAQEGASALATGLGPTVAGYFMQGAFKFGGYEFLKRRAVDALGQETASRNRTAVYLGSSALAEVAGDLALCPFEAVRIRLVSQPGFARGLWDGLATMARQEGVRGLYSGLGPIVLKQYVLPSAPVVELPLTMLQGALHSRYLRGLRARHRAGLQSRRQSHCFRAGHDRN